MKKKEVAIIIPNTPFLINEKVFPNIGALRVATQLKEEGHSVEVLDFSGKTSDYILPYANDFEYFGFSSTTPQFPYTMNIYNKLKQKNPNAKTILGGPHASALYKLKMKGKKDININDLEVFDTIFAGEGEDTEYIFTPGWQKGKLIKNIDDTLIPDRDLIDIASYHYNLFGKDTTTIMTQRGCPYQCAFCSGRDIEMYNRTRMHSVDRVMKEMDELNKKYGHTSFMWYDDELNLNMNRLEQLCSELSKRNYQHRGFIRSNNIVKYPESVNWLKDAGFVKLCAGVESGSDRMLKNINKMTTSEMNSQARKIIGDVGIHYEAFMLVGHPDETFEDIKLTRKWLIDNKPDDFDLNIIAPYPGSKMYDDSVPTKKFKNYKYCYNGMYFNKPRYSNVDSFYKGVQREGASKVRTNELTYEQLLDSRYKVEKEVREYICQ